MRTLGLVTLAVLCVATAAAQETRPLEASLRRGAEPLFSVDQPAFVAVFEIIPGVEVQQLYPRSGYQAQSPIEPGEYLLSRPFRSQYDYSYSSQGWGVASPYARPMVLTDAAGRVVSYYYATSWGGVRNFGMSRTLLLVASRMPLRQVSSPLAAQYWLQRVAGFRAISNVVAAPSAMLADIVESVLPTGARVDDVVVDVLEIVDDSFLADNGWMGSTMRFTCPNGVYSMPAEFFFDSGMFRCPTWTPTSTVTSAPAAPKPVDDDSLKLFPRRVPTDVYQRGAPAGAAEGVTLRPRATVIVDEVTPYPIYRAGRGGVEPTSRAWTPPVPAGTGNDGMDGYRRYTRNPAGGSTGSGSSGSASSGSSDPESYRRFVPRSAPSPAPAPNPSMSSGASASSSASSSSAPAPASSGSPAQSKGSTVTKLPLQ